jgi:DNA-directed RNA polymerase specialized sigma24 family protein
VLRRTAPPANPAKPGQAQRRLTPTQVAELVRQYEAGADMKVLAANWHMHRATVAGQLRRAGVERRRRGVPQDKLPEVIRLYLDGWSLQRLAERYGCDDETVRRALQRSGTQLRAPWERP